MGTVKCGTFTAVGARLVQKSWCGAMYKSTGIHILVNRWWLVLELMVKGYLLILRVGSRAVWEWWIQFLLLAGSVQCVYTLFLSSSCTLIGDILCPMMGYHLIWRISSEGTAYWACVHGSWVNLGRRIFGLCSSPPTKCLLISHPVLSAPTGPCTSLWAGLWCSYWLRAWKGA